MIKRNKSQVASEFTILIWLALLITMIFILFLYTSGKSRTDERINAKMNDFGASLQNEFVLASQMNDGYVRNLKLKDNIESTDYNITILSQKLLMLSYAERNIYFKIPRVNGSISKGNNIITKIGDDILISQ